jgi:hypothetical protein
MKLEAVCAAVSLSLVSAVGCDALHTMHSDHTGQHGTAPTPPTTTFAPLAWIESPPATQLTAFLCTLLGADTPLSSDATTACRASGPTPVPSALRFQVRSESTIENRGMVRLTMESVLLVFTAYPEGGASQALGAVCLTLCDEGATQCPQTNEACRSTSEGVVELGDLEHPGGLVSSIAVEENRVADLAVRSLAPHGSTPLTVDLAIDAQRLLAAVRANDAAVTDAIRAGTAPTYAIPYAIEGTIWVDGRGNDGFAEPMARTTGVLEIP